MHKKALVIVDVLNDFLPGGALPVPRGDEIIEPINQMLPHYNFVIAANDRHPSDHKSFIENGGQWNAHCIEGTPGCEFPEELNSDSIGSVYKGWDRQVESYSGFMDESGRSTGLHELLVSKGITAIDVVGLALDYCVYHTAIDAYTLGFETAVLLDGCRGLEDESQTIGKLRGFGVKVCENSKNNFPEEKPNTPGE